MSDTIGTHLAESAKCSRSAEFFMVQSVRSDANGHSFRAELRRMWAAHYEGAAAGHAFRAAELAYDMGIAQQAGR